MNREFTFEAETPLEHKPCGCGKKEIEPEQFEFGEAAETYEFDEAEEAFEFDESEEEDERGRPPAGRAVARPGGRPGMGSGPRRPAAGMRPGGMKPGMGARPGMGGRPARPGMGAKPGMGGRPVRPGMGAKPGMGARPGMGGRPARPGMGAKPGMGGRPARPGMGAKPGMGGRPARPGMGAKPGFGAEPSAGGPLGASPGFPGPHDFPQPGPGAPPRFPRRFPRPGGYYGPVYPAFGPNPYPPEPAPPEGGSSLIGWAKDCLNQILNLQLPADGTLDRQTRSAVRSFQRGAGIYPSGILSPATEAALQDACSQRGAAPAYEPATGPDSEPSPPEDGAPASANEPPETDSELDSWIRNLAAQAVQGRRASGQLAETGLFNEEVQSETVGGVPVRDYLKWVQGSLNLYFEKAGIPVKILANGKDSPEYRQAVRRFKDVAKIKPLNDQVDEKTQNALILANESNQKYLASTRALLDKVGYAYLTSAYGKYEKPTAAIKEFQKDYDGKFGFKLLPDGFIGAKTLLALLHAVHAIKPKPVKPKQDWIFPDELQGRIERDLGEEVLAWAMIPPTGTEAKEFSPMPSLQSDYGAIFAWKSQNTGPFCGRDHLQFILLLRDDQAYWDKRVGGSFIQRQMVQTAAAANIRDYRDYVVGRKICPYAAQLKMRLNNDELLSQMRLALLQLIPLRGVLRGQALSSLITKALGRLF